MDAGELLWENLMPMISRTTDATGRAFSEVAVFPQDCIEVSPIHLYHI